MLSKTVTATLIATLVTCVAVTAEARQSDEARSTPSVQAAAIAPQSNVPTEVRQAQNTVERNVRKFRAGVSGGVGLDPELIMFGAHATFGPIFRRGVDFRPGVEVGLGELTTLLSVNMDVIYRFRASDSDNAWIPYIGAGPSLGFSHRGFETDNGDAGNVSVNSEDVVVNDNRFNFSDSDFNGGMNFIAGARRANGVFIELKATAWGVSNIRFMAGYNF